ncbi:MAG: hypothetical protein ACRDZZ_14115, partial [Ilumatobacteraceae bacterium]
MPPTKGAHPSATRAAHRFVVVAGIAALLLIGVVATAPQRRAIAQDDEIDLSLVAQNFAVAPDGVLHLEYDLMATMPELDEATTPTTTTTTTTTTTSTTSTTTVAPEGVDAATAVPPTTAAPTTPATTPATTPTTTATTTVPPPVSVPEFSVRVTALEPITLRSEVSAVLGGDFRRAVDSAVYDLVETLVDEPAATSSTRRRLVLDVQTATRGEVRRELALPRAGLYPITVEVRYRNLLLDRHVTFMERLATTESGVYPRSQLNLSVVASIPDPGPEPDALDLVESTARITELAQLGEVVTAPLTVSVPPVVATALAGEPELAARLRAALAGDEVLAQPQALLDPSAAVAAGLAEAFTRELREGEDVLRQALPSTASRRVAWLATEPLSAGGASMLRDLGVQIVVTPFDVYLGLDSNQSTAVRNDLTDPSLLIAGDLPGGGELALGVVDPIGALLETDRGDAGTPTEIAVHLFADLMALRIQLGPAARSVILATPDLGIPDPDVLADVEDFADEHPDVGFQALSFVPGTTGPFMINGEPVHVTFPPAAGPDLAERVHAIDLVRLHMEETATMLPADDQRPARWRTELEALLSTGIDDATVSARLARIDTALAAIEQAIEPPAPFTFTLAGESNTITLRIANTGNTALRIGVRISGPSRLQFPAPDTEVLLEPNTITDVEIPVRARSNGTSE